LERDTSPKTAGGLSQLKTASLAAAADYALVGAAGSGWAATREKRSRDCRENAVNRRFENSFVRFAAELNEFSRAPHHIGCMVSASYQVIPHIDRSFSVEITEPDTLSHAALGFLTETDADTWIASDQRLASSGSHWVRFCNRYAGKH
jgi:hypothetical protein